MDGTRAAATDHYYLRGQSLVTGRGDRDPGQAIPLVREPNTIALNLKSRASLRPESLDVLRSLKARGDTEFIPQYGIRVYDTDRSERAVEVLREDPAVRFATPVYRHSEKSPDRIYLTNRFVAQFYPEVTLAQIEAFNAQHDVSIIRPLAYAPNGYVLEVPGGPGTLSALDMANLYFTSGLCRFSHPDFVTKKRFRKVATPEAGRTIEARAATSRGSVMVRGVFASQQWHLDTAKVRPAWAITKGSSDITIAILDDGVDTGHPEFAGRIIWEHDYESGVADGNPKTSTDKHGTSCAGVATAADVKAAGSAPACKLIAIRTPDNLGVSDEAQMFQDAADHGADVISCSWGPADGTGAVDPLPDATRVAIHYCITNGRGGKGIPICWAGGNGNELVSNDGYASNPEVMAIAASTSQEKKAWYSDFGPEIWICAPSNGDTSLGEKSIFTTDRRGADGYNNGDATKGDADGDYFNGFGGTSSAAPLVAGICGLILSVNASLTHQDVRDILKSTAERIGDAANYDASGHSQFFGYGRVNACAAVKEAQARASGGGGGTVTAPSVTAIPEQADASGSPPAFDVDPGSNSFFHIEAVTDPSLFASHDSLVNDESYFASWNVTDFQAASPYTLPTDAWERMKSAEKLYYRAWTSSSNTEWKDVVTTTPNDDAANAPFITIVGGVSVGDGTSDGGSTSATGGGGSSTGGTVTAPSVTAIPEQADASGAPPAFDVDPGSNSFFHIEAVTDPGLFASHDAGTNDDTYFASWNVTDFQAASPYTLPQDAWDRLKQSEKLYYRAWTSSSNTEWKDAMTTTTNDDAANAPFITVVGGASETDRNVLAERSVISERNGVTAVEPRLPTITGADTMSPNDQVPSFCIDPGDYPLYGVQVATDAGLFDDTQQSARRSDNYFATSDDGMTRSSGPTTYTLPEHVWERLRHADRLCYRVVCRTLDSTVLRYSTPDPVTGELPFIRITADTERDIAVPDHDEGLWSARNARTPA